MKREKGMEPPAAVISCRICADSCALSASASADGAGSSVIVACREGCSECRAIRFHLVRYPENDCLRESVAESGETTQPETADGDQSTRVNTWSAASNSAHIAAKLFPVTGWRLEPAISASGPSTKA